MADIIVTLPSRTEWGDYQKELDAVANRKANLRFKVGNFPSDAGRGSRCYVAWRGHVRGWMEIVGFWSGTFICEVTEKVWSGKFIERSGPFHKIDGPSMKGFQGWRYYTEDDGDS